MKTLVKLATVIFFVLVAPLVVGQTQKFTPTPTTPAPAVISVPSVGTLSKQVQKHYIVYGPKPFTEDGWTVKFMPGTNGRNAPIPGVAKGADAVLYTVIADKGNVTIAFVLADVENTDNGCLTVVSRVATVLTLHPPVEEPLPKSQKF